MTISKTKPDSRVEEMRADYRLDYSQATPNRFASKLADTSVVVLQPDVAAVFQSSDAVNDFFTFGHRSHSQAESRDESESDA